MNFNFGLFCNDVLLPWPSHNMCGILLWSELNHCSSNSVLCIVTDSALSRNESAPEILWLETTGIVPWLFCTTVMCSTTEFLSHQNQATDLFRDEEKTVYTCLKISLYYSHSPHYYFCIEPWHREQVLGLRPDQSKIKLSLHRFSAGIMCFMRIE